MSGVLDQWSWIFVVLLLVLVPSAHAEFYRTYDIGEVHFDIDVIPTPDLPGYETYTVSMSIDAPGSIRTIEISLYAPELHQVEINGNTTVYNDLNPAYPFFGFNPLQDTQVMLTSNTLVTFNSSEDEHTLLTTLSANPGNARPPLPIEQTPVPLLQVVTPEANGGETFGFAIGYVDDTTTTEVYVRSPNAFTDTTAPVSVNDIGPHDGLLDVFVHSTHGIGIRALDGARVSRNHFDFTTHTYSGGIDSGFRPYDVLFPGPGTYGFEVYTDDRFGNQTSSELIYIEVVPEPGTLALLALGGLAFIGRR